MTLGLNDYTFQLDTSGVTLNTDSSILPFVDIEKVTGLDSTPYRETIRDHEGTDGGFIDAEFEKGRELILEGTIYVDSGTVETYVDSLKANYAPQTLPIKFYYKAPGVPERFIYVKPRGVRYSWETMRRLGMTSAQFLMYAEDPRIYTNSLESTTLAYGGDTGAGLAFSFGFNVDFGGGATPGGGTVTNSGNRPSPVTFIVTGPATNPVIGNTTTGNTMRFSITLAAAETLTINSRDRTIYLNGNVNRRNTMISPDWFDLAVGANQITYGALTGTGSTLNVSFYPAWR